MYTFSLWNVYYLLILGAVKFAQEVLQDILNNIQNQNVDAIIRQAEDILDEIAARDFSNDDSTATDEYELANDSMYMIVFSQTRLLLDMTTQYAQI